MRKRIIIIIVSAIIITVFTMIIVLSFGESDSYNIDKYLIDNGYELIDKDTNEYIKETQDIDSFYYLKDSNMDTSYLAYYFSIELKTFKEVKMKYTKDTKTTLIYTLSNKLSTNIINYNYEISNDKTSYNLKGSYNIDNDEFSCDLINNTSSNKDIYCNNALDKIKSFIPKRDKVLRNKYVQNMVNTKQNEVIVGDEDE